MRKEPRKFNNRKSTKGIPHRFVDGKRVDQETKSEQFANWLIKKKTL